MTTFLPAVEKRPNRPNRKSQSSRVVSFRLKNKEVERLQEVLPGVVENNSHHLLSRKITRDFVDGRLVYLSRQDQLKSRQDD